MYKEKQATTVLFKSDLNELFLFSAYVFTYSLYLRTHKNLQLRQHITIAIFKHE